jgi:hypothetical protein
LIASDAKLLAFWVQLRRADRDWSALGPLRDPTLAAFSAIIKNQPQESRKNTERFLLKQAAAVGGHGPAWNTFFEGIESSRSKLFRKAKQVLTTDIGALFRRGKG